MIATVFTNLHKCEDIQGHSKCVYMKSSQFVQVFVAQSEPYLARNNGVDYEDVFGR